MLDDAQIMIRPGRWYQVHEMEVGEDVVLAQSSGCWRPEEVIWHREKGSVDSIVRWRGKILETRIVSGEPLEQRQVTSKDKVHGLHPK
jgi:hypothetical protein